MRHELPLHDSILNGVVLAGKSARLHFVQTNLAPYVVELSGIDAMQMDDFREGNIVSIFEAIQGEEPSTEVGWDRLYPPPHPTAAEQYHQEYRELLRSKQAAIAAGKLTLVQMVPSLGADLLVVCESLETVEA